MQAKAAGCQVGTAKRRRARKACFEMALSHSLHSVPVETPWLWMKRGQKGGFRKDTRPLLATRKCNKRKWPSMMQERLVLNIPA